MERGVLNETNSVATSTISGFLLVSVVATLIELSENINEGNLKTMCSARENSGTISATSFLFAFRNQFQ